MSYWHEEPTHTRVIRPRLLSGVATIIRYDNAVSGDFEIHFMRYDGIGKPLMWQRFPDDWWEFWPIEPIRATHLDQAKAASAGAALRLESGDETGFTKRRYEPSVRPIVVKEIDHPDRMAKAIIAQHADGRFQVFYHVYAPDGLYLPVSTPSVGELGWEWGQAGPLQKTFADSLQSALEIAAIKLAEIVAGDPEIKQRIAEE